MKRIVLLILLIFQSSFAISINESLLKIHAVLLPKISLMDYNFEKKLYNDAIVIAILYDTNEYKSAVLLQEEIENRYKSKIKNYTIKTKLVPYSKIKTTDATLYYLLPTNEQNIKKVVAKAAQLKALTFSYIANDLKDGVMLSLKIDTKIKPIINLGAVKENQITFRPVLLKISHIYRDEKYHNELPNSTNYYKNCINIAYVKSRECYE